MRKLRLLIPCSGETQRPVGFSPNAALRSESLELTLNRHHHFTQQS